MQLKRIRLDHTHVYYALAGLSCLVLAFCGLSRLILRPMFASDSPWRSYYTVAVAHPADAARLALELQEAGMETVSPAGTFVTISTYHDLERVPISKMTDRLDVRDPRRDPFVVGLADYFSARVDGETWSALYLRKSLPPALMALRIQRALAAADVDWRLLEWSAPRRLLSFLLFGGFAFFLFLRAGQGRLIVGAAGLALAGVCTDGSYFGLATGCFLLAAWACFGEVARREVLYRLNYGFRGPTRGFPRLPGLALAAALLVSLLLLLPASTPRGALLSLGLCLCSLLGSLGLETALCFMRRSRQEHRVFYPVLLSENVTFVRRRPGASANVGFQQNRLPVRYATAAILLLAPLSLVLVPSGGGVRAAQPMNPVSADEVSWASLEELASVNVEGRLPNLADYLTHRAFQEGLPVTDAYVFPRPNVGVRTVAFTDGGTSVVPRAQVFLEYDREWYEGVMAEARGGGVTRMLSSTGLVFEVSIAPIPTGTISPAMAILHLFFCIIALTPYLFFGDNLTAQLFYGMRDQILRRKRQAA